MSRVHLHLANVVESLRAKTLQLMLSIDIELIHGLDAIVRPAPQSLPMIDTIL